MRLITSDNQNTLHISYEELRGLILDAQEILDVGDIPENFILSVDQTIESPVRVAAYRLTNCIGNYDSGRTENGVEPRWAFKSGGTWHCSKPGVQFNTELETREWIKAAPILPAVEPPVPPGTDRQVRTFTPPPTTFRPVASTNTVGSWIDNRTYQYHGRRMRLEAGQRRWVLEVRSSISGEWRSIGRQLRSSAIQWVNAAPAQ
jgi:hypothetical protein